jgi:hypothetical protein
MANIWKPVAFRLLTECKEIDVPDCYKNLEQWSKWLRRSDEGGRNGPAGGLTSGLPDDKYRSVIVLLRLLMWLIYK